MTIAFPAGTRVALLDIEGTTTPISFVRDTLFAYARAHLEGFLSARGAEPESRLAISRLSVERLNDDDSAPTSPASYARWLMDRDRKSPALKQLQGLIWEQGYKAGELRGLVWDDVPRAMERWRASGLRIAIYSSGSELAQRRLFESVSTGDLTPLIERFFDTAVGGKMQPASYDRIAAELDVTAADVTFISDVTAELAAARDAGCHAVLYVREGNAPQPEAAQYPAITTFDELATQ